jgi:hypothetical protein
VQSAEGESACTGNRLSAIGEREREREENLKGRSWLLHEGNEDKFEKVSVGVV